MGYASVASLSGLRMTSSSLLAVALLLLALASPALAAPANQRRRTTTTIKRTTTSLPLSDVNMDDVMLGDDAYALHTRQIHSHKSNPTHFTLINVQNQNYLVISDGQVKGQKAPAIGQDPPHSLLTMGKVSTGCVHKHCNLSTFVTLSEVTSHMYICVNKRGHFYSQKFASSEQTTSDCWFVQLMEHNHVAFYSASRGGKLKQPRCVPHSRHQRYRRHNPRTHRGRHRRETEGCRRWFVSIHENGHVSRGPRSNTPDEDKWLRSTFVLNRKDYHVTQQGGHRPVEAELVPSPLPQAGSSSTTLARTTQTRPPSSPPTSLPVPSKTKGKTKAESKGQQHKRRRGRKQRKDNDNKKQRQHVRVDTTPQPCVETFTGSCRHLTAAGSQGHKASKTPTSQLTAADLLPFIN